MELRVAKHHFMVAKDRVIDKRDEAASANTRTMPKMSHLCWHSNMQCRYMLSAALLGSKQKR